MVKVLVATTEGQGRRHDDYAWAVDGELVYIPARACMCPGCGCERGFSGMASNRSTTTALVVDRPDLTVADLRHALFDSIERQGLSAAAGGPTTPDRRQEPSGNAGGSADRVRPQDLFRRLLAAVSHFQVGSIIEREGDLLRRRALAEPLHVPYSFGGDGP